MYSVSIHKISEFLQQKIGLNPESIGYYMINRAVQNCMLSHGMSSIEQYRLMIENDEQELRRLIESVVIPETSFFRDREPFKALMEYARTSWPGRTDGRMFRALSLPCSTGEEPYSIAMSLREAGLAEDRMEVHAMDISDSLLDVARAGIYTEYSFRGCDESYKEKYFTRQGSKYLIDSSIKDSVSFSRANILEETIVTDAHGYDVIFCRNLLIYFDRYAKEKALNGLLRKLSKTGILFVGHAETAILQAHGMHRIPWNMAFAYAFDVDGGGNIGNAQSAYSKASKMSGVELYHNVMRQLSGAGHHGSKSGYGNGATADALSLRHGHGARASVTSTIREAEGIMDDCARHAQALEQEYMLGNHERLSRICEAMIVEGACASLAYQYKALMELAQGNYLQSEELFKKALFLDPVNHSALINLSEIAQKLGNEESARKYRLRADRIMQRNPKAKG